MESNEFFNEESINRNNQIGDYSVLSESFNGLTKVYLEKNIISGNNILTQSMISQSDTIYYFNYDFDLNGVNINIYNNCILVFNGGSISNGSINGNNTIIEAPSYHILKNVTITGLFKNKLIDVRWFGIVGDGITDNTSKIQSLINYINSKQGGTLFFPIGTYRASRIGLKQNVSIEGELCERTIFMPTSSSYPSFFYIAENGPIYYVNYSNFSLHGNSANQQQNGLDLTALEQTSYPYTGGLWYSNFSNIKIRGFKGTALNLRARDINGDLANQFLTFIRVDCFREENTESRALKINGQGGQFKFINCEFDGFSTTVNTINVELSPWDAGQDITDTSDSDRQGCIDFDTCTFQSADLGIKATYVWNIKFTNCWFESLNNTIRLETVSYATFWGCFFANAALTGSVFYLGNQCSVVVDSCYAIAGNNKIITGVNGNAGSRFINNFGFNGVGFEYVNLDQELLSNTISTEYKKFVSISASSQGTITRINSKIDIFDTVTIFNNSNSIIKINGSDNILVKNGYRIELNSKNTAVLQRVIINSADCWIPISTTGQLVSDTKNVMQDIQIAVNKSLTTYTSHIIALQSTNQIELETIDSDFDRIILYNPNNRNLKITRAGNILVKYGYFIQLSGGNFIELQKSFIAGEIRWLPISYDGQLITV